MGAMISMGVGGPKVSHHAFAERHWLHRRGVVNLSFRECGVEQKYRAENSDIATMSFSSFWRNQNVI